MEIQNKENICRYEKTAVDVKPASRTPMRTPLQDLNRKDVISRSVQKSAIGSVAAQELSTKTPTRKSLKFRRSILVYYDKENQQHEGSKEVLKLKDSVIKSAHPPEVKVIPPTPFNDTSLSNSQNSTSSPDDPCEQDDHQAADMVEVVSELFTSSEKLDDEEMNHEDEIIDEFDIYIDHEELCDGGSSCFQNTSSDVLLISDNDLATPLEDNALSDGTDHTYAGLRCQSCDSKSGVGESATLPMTPISRTSVEILTENLHRTEIACSPMAIENNDVETMVEINTNDIGCSPCNSCWTEQETMTDPMTPIRLPETCDISIQHLIDTVSAACSPLPQDMLSAACSPMPSQFTADYTDIGCSPAFKSQTTETHTMTNDTPVKHDMGLQAIPDTVSVLCSPLHNLTREFGVSAVSTQLDGATNTEIIEQMDQGVDVRPMMTVDSTMTEYFLVDSETSMTPVKFLNKKGHRITAEEIRKQHPRTLANKLDTYAIETERMKMEIVKVEKERDHFKSKISDLRTTIKEKAKVINENQERVDDEQNVMKKNYAEKIDQLTLRLQESEDTVRQLKDEICQWEIKSSEERNQLMSEIECLKSKCQGLENQISETEQFKSREIDLLREEIEKRQNDHQMKSAHNLILELQTELSEYKELTDSLKLAEQLQSEIQHVVSENYRKVRAAADRLMKTKRDLDVERVEVAQQKDENVKETERLATEYREMTEKYDNLKSSLETSRSGMMQIESLYESTSADLLSATNQVQILSQELISTKSDFKDLTVVKASLAQQVEDLQQNGKAAISEISSLQNTIDNKETEYETLKTGSEDKEMKLNTRIDTIQTENQRLDLLAVNLQRTIDSLNDDIDTLENDLFATREFSSEQASRIIRLDESLSIAVKELDQIKQENMELRDSLAVFRGNQDYLQQSVDRTEKELARKSSKLKKQTTELQDSTSLVVDLENKMAALLKGLRTRAGLNSKVVLQTSYSSSKQLETLKSVQKSDSENFGDGIMNSCRKTCDQSFLSMVIKAAEGPSDSEYESCKSSPSIKSSGNTSPFIEGVTPFEEEMSTICEKLKDSLDESPSSLSRNKLGFSQRNSAFAPVRTSVSAIKSRPGPLDSTTKNLSVMSQSQLEDCSLGLSEQIECLAETFSEIMRCASVIEKASRLSIQDLQEENEDLCQQLEECQTTESKTQEELSLKISQLTEAEEKISTLTENITSLSEKIGFFVRQEAEMSYLKTSLSDTKSQIAQLEAEKQILTNQLKEVLNGVNGTTSPSENFARYHSDITTLKLKIQKLKQQLKQREEYHEQLAVKASKRMKTLDDNWKKAEEEVYKFDQLVDTIRETLINSGLIPKNKESLGRIVRMIDGFESVPSKPATLNPVKTALW